jgi:hypothetical protein
MEDKTYRYFIIEDRENKERTIVMLHPVKINGHKVWYFFESEVEWFNIVETHNILKEINIHE